MNKEESKACGLLGKGRWFRRGGKSQSEFPSRFLLMGMSLSATGAWFQIPLRWHV